MRVRVRSGLPRWPGRPLTGPRVTLVGAALALCLAASAGCSGDGPGASTAAAPPTTAPPGSTATAPATTAPPTTAPRATAAPAPTAVPDPPAPATPRAISAAPRAAAPRATTPSATTPKPAIAKATVPAPLVVIIRNFAFLPQNPVLAAGQAVVIVNQDSAAHTWTAAPRSGWTYDSGNIGPGQRATFPGLARPGRYPVLCLYHAEMPAMNGTVTVR